MQCKRDRSKENMDWIEFYTDARRGMASSPGNQRRTRDPVMIGINVVSSGCLPSLFLPPVLAVQVLVRFGRRNTAPKPGVDEQQRLARSWDQRGNSCSVRGKCARRETRVCTE
jgi:hypothetical protein